MSDAEPSDRLADALSFAARAFRGRVRKGTAIPYLTHLLQVTTWVGEHGGDEDQMIAAVLHDYVEDIEGATVAEVRERFGDRVARLVDGLSDAYGKPKPPWRERKEAYLAHLRDAPAELKLISAADKLHNATSILRDLGAVGDALWDRFTASREESLWYYDSVIDALGHGFDHPLIDELRATVARIHEVGRSER
jgi:(p)ppGpp synthase/HD superfamily hydrolase